MHIKIISGMAEDQIYVTEVSQSGEFHRMILTQVQMSTLFAFGNKDVLFFGLSYLTSLTDPPTDSAPKSVELIYIKQLNCIG